jgi:hypothetical protein
LPKGLSYADATRLLGGQNSKIIDALDKVTGGILLGAAVGVPALLGWLEARAEFARLCQDLVKVFSERRSGLSRYARTERLYAAHSVLVVAAYFEALGEADLPFRFSELKLSKDEQLILTDDGTNRAAGLVSIVDRLLDVSEETLPLPQVPHEILLQYLQNSYYPRISKIIKDFMDGLMGWLTLGPVQQDQFSRALEAVPLAARNRYEELFRKLAADFPEVACWASAREHQATRSEIRNLANALSDLEHQLQEIATRTKPSQHRLALADAHRADLTRPIVESGDVPVGLYVPTLGAAYVSPLFRVQSLAFADNPSDESWWEQAPTRGDMERFLIGYLTSPQAVGAPLLVLGQPGSGKSVLTRVLAARLPATDFLPIRVALREVATESEIQDQLEQGIRLRTGERMDWPTLSRSAGKALPVILLDGFDELLQATGVSQSDYLTKVAAFQQREADQKRPVVVIVTTRTSVADRARIPPGSVALRLEPFDPVRISAWLEIWNMVNAQPFYRRGQVPLTAEAVLAHGDMVRQPLLLLMFALYDADGNALQNRASEFSRTELYEQLLHRFASREIMKNRPDLPDRDLSEAVEIELRRLSIAAFGMFNRRSQWISEADLEEDLTAVFGRRHPVTTGSMRAPLGEAETLLGRFFFVHRAQARRDDKRLETYEFLHATFGEFLIARFIEHVVRDIAARTAASTISLSVVLPDDDLLYALLSFTVLSARGSVIEFFVEVIERLQSARREAQADVLKQLFQVAHEPRPSRNLERYQPLSLSVPTRHAAYSANLMLLAVCSAGHVAASELFADRETAVSRWHSHALLWRSQLGNEEWVTLAETIELRRLWNGSQRDLRLSIDLHGFIAPATDPSWTFSLEPSGQKKNWRFFTYSNQTTEKLRRHSNFMCAVNDDVMSHALDPLLATLEESLGLFVKGFPDESCRSPANALLDVWLLPLRDLNPDLRRVTYERCAVIATTLALPFWDREMRCKYASLLLDRLATDTGAGADLAAEILELLMKGKFADSVMDLIGTKVAKCSLAFLDYSHANPRIGKILYEVLMPDLSYVDVFCGAEALVQLSEHDLPLPPLLQFEPDRYDELHDLLRRVATHRPMLAERLQQAIEKWRDGQHEG